ncbi:MAG: PilZ domain-containing protein [Candidatus Omnitrophota bacterium]
MVTPEGKVAQERRDFFRINFKTPLEFRTYGSERPSRKTENDSPRPATSQNISQTGILFKTQSDPPDLSSILWMNMDIRTLHVCQEIEKRAVTFNQGLLGKVVRVEEDPEDGAYDVGVCFLTQNERNSRSVQKLLSELSKNS